MKLVCEKEKILRGINSVINGVSSKTTMPILEGILLKTNDNELILTTYDLEMRVICPDTRLEDLQTVADCLNEM